MSIQQFFEILKARFWIAVLVPCVMVATTLLVSLFLPKEYTARTTLVVDIKGIDPLTGLNSPAQLLPGYMATQIDIIRSHSVALKVVDRLKLAERPEAREQFTKVSRDSSADIRDWVADAILKKVDIKPSRESNVVEIEYSGADPRLAAVLVNTFAESYIATNLELKTEPARQYAVWFEQQIKALRENMENAQARLTLYQQNTDFVPLDERADVETAKVTELVRQLTAAQSQSLDARSRLHQPAMARKGDLADASPDVLGNEVVRNLKANLAIAEAKLAEVAEKYDTNHPRYKQASAEVRSLRHKLAAEIKTVLSSIAAAAQIARKREEEFKAAFVAQKTNIMELNKRKHEMGVLTREVDQAQETYMSALKRFNDTRLESQTNQTNVAILNRAIPPLQPSKPRIMLNMTLSVFLGTLLGVGTVFMMELFDRRIRTMDDLALGLEVPVLGVLAAEKQRTELRKRLGFRTARSAPMAVVLTGGTREIV